MTDQIQNLTEKANSDIDYESASDCGGGGGGLDGVVMVSELGISELGIRERKFCRINSYPLTHPGG